MLDHYFKSRNWKGTIIDTVELNIFEKISCCIKCSYSTQRARNVFQNNSECNHYNADLVVSNVILYIYSLAHAISKNGIRWLLRLKRCQTKFLFKCLFNFSLQKFKCTLHFILDPEKPWLKLNNWPNWFFEDLTFFAW